jgi:mannan endo-1,4-beta-mannosidase
MPEHTVVPTRVRLLAVLMVIALGAVSYSIWTSPLARKTAQRILTNPLPVHGGVAADTEDEHSPAAHRPEEVASRATKRAAPAAVPKAHTRLAAQGAHPRAAPVSRPSTSDVVRTEQAPPVTVQSAPRPAKRPTRCFEFRWQQDSQAVYLANLADPYGLDGRPGPADDDGIACAELPVDPARPASLPVGARVIPKPAAPPLASLLAPAKRFYGIYTEQSPYRWGEVDRVTTAVGKVPNLAGYFSAGDENFRADAVISAWTRGMLPLLTWELRPKADMGPGSDTALPRPGYSLAEIATGSLDPYLRTYAHAVAALNLPLAIRLDHEMNGAWYPWSIYSQKNGRDGKTGAEWYRLMWQHVHDIFVQAGATKVIWVWSPNIITWSRSDFRNFYPGTDYVDWIGLSGYYRRSSEQPTFDSTFGATLRKLRNPAVFPHAAKPILLSEIGATENGGSKAVWINDLFTAFSAPENADLVGFAWFHNTVTSSPGEPGARTNDWRITSSKAAITAFRDGIADPAFGAGR